MNDDYLWDRSGDPDPETARLEQLLARYRHDEAPLRAPRPLRTSRRRTWLALAASLFILIAAGAIALAYRFHWPSGAAWQVIAVSGAPTLDGKTISAGSRLPVGSDLRTDGRSRAIVRIARVGDLEVAPNSHVKLTATRRGVHRMQLERGTISARVWAPPFTFGVRTPAGLASDLGCMFTLHYANGTGRVTVLSGWVDFDGPTRSSVIPAGAIAELRQSGPGTPFYPDAVAPFRGALRRFDFAGDRDALREVMAHARQRDAMTLLHLIEHSEEYPEWRAPLFERLVQLAPPPQGVTRERILQRDLQQLDAWRQSLGIASYKKWWLQWRDALPDGGRPAR